MRIIQNITKELNSPIKVYISGEFLNSDSDKYRKYTFRVFDRFDKIGKQSLLNKTSEELIPVLYDNTVVTFTFQSDIYERMRKSALTRRFDVKYSKHSAIEILARYLLKEKDKKFIWTCYKGEYGFEKIVILQDCIDTPFVNKISRIYEYNSNKFIGQKSVTFFIDTQIQCQENKYETAKSYDKNKDYLIKIRNPESWDRFHIVVNNDYMPFDKLVEKIAPVFEKNGFVFASKVDPFEQNL